MNPLQHVYVKAREGGLPAGMDSGYFGSDDFAARLCYEGAQGVQDQVSVLVFMLGRIAVNPRGVEHMRGNLARGVVALDFFGWCNPVPLLELEQGGDLARIVEAFEANVAGTKFAAAVRVLRWREPGKVWRRGRQEDAVVDRLRGALVWPTGQSWEAEQERVHLVATVHEKRQAVRNRRNDRLAILAQASGMAGASWHEFLHAVAAAVFAPAPVVN